jgi:hypothetical protein
VEQCSLLNCPAHQYICHPQVFLLLSGWSSAASTSTSAILRYSSC